MRIPYPKLRNAQDGKELGCHKSGLGAAFWLKIKQDITLNRSAPSDCDCRSDWVASIKTERYDFSESAVMIGI